MPPTNRPVEGWVAIVDDDESIRRSLVRLFRIHGIRADAFASAEEYLGRGSVDEPACLVVDVNLVGVSGFDLQGRLGANGKTPPIIFMSADDVSETQLDDRPTPHGYLTKPFDTKVLLALVRQHVGGDTRPATRSELRDQSPAA